MVQNLKIDIIYYDTPSDFEFEFNLGGCCHSRVLNTKAPTPKEMIGCLSKAVCRSRVIIVIGKLNEQDGLFNLISKAIGMPLEEIDDCEYGIAEDSPKKVIASSLPLVSNDGLLAGCIVESGPQSIILLPDSKSLRKEIAETLVFQYITAISRTPDIEPVIEPNNAEKPEKEVLSEQIAQETEENTEENLIPLENAQTETEETEPVLELNSDTNFNEEEEKEEDIPFILEEETGKATFTEDKNDNEDVLDIDPQDDNDDNICDTVYPKKGLNIAIIIISALLFIVAAILTYMLVYKPLNSGMEVTEYIKQLFNL